MITPAQYPAAREIRCARCNEVLYGKRIRWLELDLLTGVYSDPTKGQLPVTRSQGAFPFGLKCAKVQLGEGLP
jgi:hypothetical protein